MGVSARVFYADGHRASSQVVRAALHQLGVEVTHFDNGEGCLDCLKSRKCHLLISNARRPEVEGLQLLRGARHIKPSVPVIMLVDHGDIPVAVWAMKSGAVDCLERPPERGYLVSVIDAVLQESFRNGIALEKPLTKMETRVLRLVLRGCTTTAMGRRLHRSQRTIEVHRSHIMHKLEVDGMVNLVKRCAQLGLLGDWP